MHYTPVETFRYGTVHVNHNSDWSGKVSIAWVETNVETGETVSHNVQLPGDLLIRLSRDCALEYLKSELVTFLEGLG